MCHGVCARFSGGKDSGRDEITVPRVREAQPSRNPERESQADVAEYSAHGGADDESEPERGAEHSELRRALIDRRHVGNVCARRRNARRGDPRNHASDEQPRHGWGESHYEIVEAESEVGEKHHGAAPVAVRQRTDDR